MKRKIQLTNINLINKWVSKSIDLFKESPYLDKILEIYPFQVTVPQRIDADLRRQIIMAHQSRETNKLISLLKQVTKFPYEDPIWFMLKNIDGCIENNPKQIKRIAESLYSMTAEETVVRIESAPSINTQMGPMFTNWTRRNFELLSLEDFIQSQRGIFVLDASEEEAKNYINKQLRQNLTKRPDLVAKVNDKIIIGEAKWIGQPGGNQHKQVVEVLDFCKKQRANVIRVGIIDGYPWAVYKNEDTIIESKEAVLVQESEYDMITALLLEDYLKSWNH